MKGIYRVDGKKGYIKILLLERAKYKDIVRLEIKSHGMVNQVNMQIWEVKEIIKGLKMALISYK